MFTVIAKLLIKFIKTMSRCGKKNENLMHPMNYLNSFSKSFKSKASENMTMVPSSL
jgi:hypothetical protein